MIKLKLNSSDSKNLIYTAYSEDNELGHCRFAICGYMLEIYELSLEDGADIGIADGLIRAAFTYAVERMVVYATVDSSVDKSMLIPLGIPSDCDTKEFSIVTFFGKCGQCSKNN